jgi:hypothetical protein
VTNPTIQAAEAMREAAIAALRGLRVSGGDCEGAGSVDLETGFADCTLGSACLCAHFNHAIEEALAVLRALPLPEPAPDPREATIARLSADLETASNSVLDALNHLDPIVHALGIEDSFKTPLEAIAEKDDEIARLSAELAAAKSQLYAPGRWRCPKCNFGLTQMKMRASDGTVGSRDDPGEKCPNCDTPLWRVTEREAGDELAERCAEQMQRAIKAEDDLAAAQEWRPIETAPKDGTHILLYAPAREYAGKPTEPRLTYGYWMILEHGEYLGDCGGECRCPEYGDTPEPSWYSEDGGFIPENPPTHWKALPLPPRAILAKLSEKEPNP